jgi:hypothetical protein
MSYPRRTRTKSHALQRGPGADLTFTTVSDNRNTSSFPPVPGPSTAPSNLRKRTTSSSSTSTKTPSRKRASSATAVPSPFQSQPFLFTPSSPPIVRPRKSISNLGSPPPYTPFPLATKSRSSSHLSQSISTATFLAQYSPQRMRPTQGASSDSELDPDPLDENEDSMIYTAKHLGNGLAFRSRILPRHSKGITTAPGQLGAGETETEADEPVRTPLPFLLKILTLLSTITTVADTFANCAYRTDLRSARAAKYPRTGSHPSPIRGVPTALHCTRGIWGTLQPLSRVLRAHQCKDHSN